MFKLFFTIIFVSLLPIFLLLLLLLPVNFQSSPRKLPKRETARIIRREEALTHLHFYFHDIVSGRNPTSVRVAEAPVTNTSASFFGEVVVLDDPLTEGPDIRSKLVGRAQGLYASAAMEESGLLMVLNYVFVEGKYKGSTLSVLGRNPVFSTAAREMPIVGGSGMFRFGRGYVEARTYSFDLETGDAVVEYDVYVLH